MKNIILAATLVVSMIGPLACTASADTLRRKQAEILTTAPDTPFLPAYTGVKPQFVRAFKTMHLKSGLVSLETELEAREEPEQILTWYRSAMRQYNWNVESFGDPSSVTGTRLTQGNQCTIHVRPSNEDGFRTRVIISYQIFKPTPVEDEDLEGSGIANTPQQQVR